MYEFSFPRSTPIALNGLVRYGPRLKNTGQAQAGQVRRTATTNRLLTYRGLGAEA
jgi:hypothetical protein